MNRPGRLFDLPPVLALAVTCIALLGLAGCSSAPQEPPDLMAEASGALDLATVELPGRLDRMRGHLLAGDSERALRAAPGRGWIYGETTRDVAFLYTLEAIAHQELGNETDARCRWAQARFLYPALTEAQFGDLPPLWVGFAREGEVAPAQGPPDAPREVSSRVLPPTKLEAPNPWYTTNMLQRRVQGRAIVRAIIDETGAVTDIEMLKSEDVEIGLQTIGSICRWTFEPATLDGEPVPVYYNLTMNFGIE